jgi:hypothetical protein
VTETAHWQGRYKTEEILEVGCPRCGSLPHRFCDRSGDRLTRRGEMLRRQGIPPSHQERMWLRQGHDLAELAGLRVAIRPGRYAESRTSPVPAAGGAECDCGLAAMPVRGVRSGREFTGWACPAGACSFSKHRAAR